MTKPNKAEERSGGELTEKKMVAGLVRGARRVDSSARRHDGGGGVWELRWRGSFDVGWCVGREGGARCSGRPWQLGKEEELGSEVGLGGKYLEESRAAGWFSDGLLGAAEEEAPGSWC